MVFMYSVPCWVVAMPTLHSTWYKCFRADTFLRKWTGIFNFFVNRQIIYLLQTRGDLLILLTVGCMSLYDLSFPKKRGIRRCILSLTSPLCLLWKCLWKRIEPTMLLFAALLLRVEQHLKGSASLQVKGCSCHSCFPIQIHVCLKLSTNDETILLWSHPTDTAKITFHSFL